MKVTEFAERVIPVNLKNCCFRVVRNRNQIAV